MKGQIPLNHTNSAQNNSKKPYPYGNGKG